MSEISLVSGAIEYLEGEKALGGDGFYFLVLDHDKQPIGSWIGPFTTRQEASDAFLVEAEQVLLLVTKKFLNLE